MRRGEICTVARGKDCAGKPRAAVILQDDRFDTTDSMTVCAFTADPTDAPLFRLLIATVRDQWCASCLPIHGGQNTTVPKVRLGHMLAVLLVRM